MRNSGVPSGGSRSIALLILWAGLWLGLAATATADPAATNSVLSTEPEDGKGLPLPWSLDIFPLDSGPWIA